MGTNAKRLTREPPILLSEISQYMCQNSKLLAFVVCIVELVYTGIYMGLAIWAEQQELHTQFLLKPARKAYCPNTCTVRNMSADLTNKPNLAIYYVV